MDEVEFLAQRLNRVTEAGLDLAVAAIRVIRDGDGVHRLAQATSDFLGVIAQRPNSSAEEG